MRILRPEVLPDEYAAGYMGRVMYLNDLTDFDPLTQKSLTWPGRSEESRDDLSTVEMLARVADVESVQFVRGHTTLPYRRAIVFKQRNVAHGAPELRPMLKSMGMRGAREGAAYFCRRCVEEDIHFHGVTYWRRQHQLPGVFLCTKHNIGLNYTEAVNAFQVYPSTFLKTARAFDERWLDGIQNSAPIQRYLAIASDLLARSIPLDERVVGRVARARCIQLGLRRRSGPDTERLVGAFLLEAFDEGWLATLSPELTTANKDKACSAADNVIFGSQRHSAGCIYALLFAAAFESSDDAINAMLGKFPAAANKQTPNRGLLNPSDKTIRKAYIEGLGNHQIVGKTFQRGGAAKDRLVELGLPDLNRENAKTLREALEAVLSVALSLDGAARTFGVDRCLLERLLIQSANPLRMALTEMKELEQNSESISREAPAAPPQQWRRSGGERIDGGLATTN